MTNDNNSSLTNLPAGAPQFISGAGGIASAEISEHAPTVWLTANLASEWYGDAMHEAEHPGSNHRRREILFAVAAAESYLFEWTRDVVLKKEYRRIDEFFPPGSTSPIKDKWKRIPKDAAARGLISNAPNLSGTSWADFDRLVTFRNGLLHAFISRPETSGLLPQSLPTPSLEELQNLPHG